MEILQQPVLSRKTNGNGLTTYTNYLETISRTEGKRSIFGVHRAGSGEEKCNCQGLGLNIFPLCHSIPSQSYFPFICGKSSYSAWLYDRPTHRLGRMRIWWWRFATDGCDDHSCRAWPSVRFALPKSINEVVKVRSYTVSSNTLASNNSTSFSTRLCSGLKFCVWFATVCRPNESRPFSRKSSQYPWRERARGVIRTDCLIHSTSFAGFSMSLGRGFFAILTLQYLGINGTHILHRFNTRRNCPSLLETMGSVLSNNREHSLPHN